VNWPLEKKGMTTTLDSTRNREQYITFVTAYLKKNKLLWLKNNKSVTPYRLTNIDIVDYYGCLIQIRITYKIMNKLKGRDILEEYVTNKLESYFGVKSFGLHIELKFHREA
jgi:hypothetical protein